MSEIEGCAVRYIESRRAKLTAKQARRDLVCRCLVAGGDAAPCCSSVSLRDVEDWCEHCVAAQLYHKEYRVQLQLTKAILVRLERLVNKKLGEVDDGRIF